MRFLVVGVLTALTLLSFGQAKAEEPTTPHGVLRAVEQAYSAGDIAALRSLLSDDFEFLTQQGIEFSVDKYLELIEPVIQDSKCVLSFSEADLKCLTINPNTWAIPNMETRLKVTSGKKTYEVTNLVTLFMIEDTGSGTVRIFRWIEEPTSLDSCD